LTLPDLGYFSGAIGLYENGGKEINSAQMVLSDGFATQCMLLGLPLYCLPWLSI